MAAKFPQKKIHFRDPVRAHNQTPMSDLRNIGPCLHFDSNFSSFFFFSLFFVVSFVF